MQMLNQPFSIRPLIDNSKSCRHFKTDGTIFKQANKIYCSVCKNMIIIKPFFFLM